MSHSKVLFLKHIHSGRRYCDTHNLWVQWDNFTVCFSGKAFHHHHHLPVPTYFKTFFAKSSFCCVVTRGDRKVSSDWILLKVRARSSPYILHKALSTSLKLLRLWRGELPTKKKMDILSEIRIMKEWQWLNFKIKWICSLNTPDVVPLTNIQFLDILKLQAKLSFIYQWISFKTRPASRHTSEKLNTINWESTLTNTKH